MTNHLDHLPGANRLRRLSPELRDCSRRSRHEATGAERVLWEAVRGGKLCGMRFRRQHAVATFVLDFYCPARKLVVEIDGGVHDDPGVAERDRLRTEMLQGGGYRVVRFTNAEVLGDLPGVLARLRGEGRG